MTAWLSENIGTIIVGIIVFLMLAAIIRSMIKDRKAGKGSCGCGCEGCAMRDTCHKS